jgi:transposase InsO family protein
MMNQLRLKYPIPFIKRVLNISSSGYYAWQVRPPSKRDQEELRLEIEIKAAHKRTRETYGPERLQCDLAEKGVQVGISRIKRIKRKFGLRCTQKRKFKATTNSRHNLPVAENLLGQYLAGHKDLFTNEIVGYAMGERMTKTLVSDSLCRAIAAKRPGIGLMHHSDRGSQYCAHEYREILRKFGIQASMSGTGNCYDNAPMESFWSTLKQELVHHRHYRSRQDAIQEITEYIEIFYNRQRIQEGLGFLSPVVYARNYYAGLLAA